MKYKWGTKIWHDNKVWLITELDPDSEYAYQISCQNNVYTDLFKPWITGITKWVKEQDLINTKEL